MSDQESNRISKIVGWGILGLLIVIAVSIAVSVYLAPRPLGSFFPFHFGWLGGIFLIFAVFWIAKWLIWPWGGRSYPYRYQRISAQSILKERYAKGEIAKEQFEQMMHDIGEKS